MSMRFRRYSSQRSNPYYKSIISSENDQGENYGRNTSKMKNKGKECQMTKKILREDSDSRDKNCITTNEEPSKTDISSSEENDSEDSDLNGNNEYHTSANKHHPKVDLIVSGEKDFQDPDDVSEMNTLSIKNEKLKDIVPKPNEIDTKTLHLDRTDKKVSATDNNLNVIKHIPTQIPATEKKKWPQKPCVLCRKHGTRRDTRHFCSFCNIALCKSPCFSEYHSCK